MAEELGAAPQLELQMSTGVDGADAPNRLAAQDPSELIVLAATPGSPIYVGTAETNFGYAKKDMQTTVCGAGIGTMSIDPTGAIVPCASLPIASGDFRTHGFKGIWRKSTIGARRKNSTNVPASFEPAIADKAGILNAWQNITLKDYHECGTHERCGWCSKCPGLAMLEHGDALAPSTVNCRLATAKMEAARFLKSGMPLKEIRAILGVADNFGQESTRRPLVLIQLDDKHAHSDPKTIGTANFIAQATGSGCGNCGSGGCTTTASTHVGRANVGFDGGPGLELMSGSAETATVLRGFAELRQRYLAKVSS